MRRHRSLLACALLAQAALALPALADGDVRGERRPAPPVTSPAATRDVDLVVCLDTSGSMQGLIDAARKKLWDVCALLAQARPTPRLRVALLQYGGDAGAEKGHVVLHSDLTTDLDAVYEQLVGFQASGGDERVGRVLHEALTGLAWSPSSDAVRVILVAGNESADQDAEFPFRRLAGQALQRNAVVHAIYCAYGGDDPATIESWKELARCGGGEFAPITLQQAAIQVETPYDAELVQLSAALNETYLPFGARGREGQERQSAQDRNAESSGGLSSSAGRAACKGQSVYRNEGWDLVDADQQADFDWSKLKQEELPEALRGLPVPAARAKVAEVRARRVALQARVRELSALRQKAIDEALAARKGEAERTLDQALLGAIRKQGQERGLGW
jgi:hypothetical protein